MGGPPGQQQKGVDSTGAKRSRSIWWKALLVGLIVAVAVIVAACSQGGRGAEGTTLWVRVLDEGALALRSPSFTCTKGYCGSVVILGLREILGEDSFDWGTDAVPGEKYVELRLRFDPTRFDAATVVAATKQAMEKYPDPARPGPVGVVYQTESP